ncbi:MAG: NusG domain II-containing protein [Synergistaceae bacterium]|nr:NusG domain II-containing protein [Synergistaceae bacterium]
MGGRRFFGYRDVIFIFFAAAAFSVIYFYTARGAEGLVAGCAEISVDGRVVARMALDRDASYSPGGLPSVRVAVRGGAVGFVGSDCPDKICVHTGFLARPGQSAACLPNRVVVRVAAEDADALDSLVY